MSLGVTTESAGDGGRGPAPLAGVLSLPSRRASPLTAVTTRMLLAVIAVIRGSQVLAPDDPRAARLEKGDQLILVSSRDGR